MSVRKPPASLLADAFASYVGSWARERDVDKLTARWLGLLAQRLSLAVSAGHVCLPLADMENTEEWPVVETLRELLLASGLVGTPGRAKNLPMVLDEENRLYLHRYFDYERKLAAQLLAFGRKGTDTGQSVREHLDTFFGPLQPDEKADWQRIAAALAMQKRLTVISGGPGTGKTTTVANMLACLLAEAPQTRILLAAPTGKAAMRMLEAIREQASKFPASVQAGMPAEAYTLHRLLGMTSRTGIFRHHAGNPLALDVLVLDEASMIDLAMASRLFDALPAHARLIMLGDKDQLSAVEAGAVFSELSADPTLSTSCVAALSAMTGIAAGDITPSKPARKSPLADTTVWLAKNFRFSADSGISNLALAIRDGRVLDARKILEEAPDGSVIWLSMAALPSLQGKTAHYLQEGYHDYFSVVTQQPENRAAVFDAFERFRVLCATHEGSHGVRAVNVFMTQYFHRAFSAHLKKGEWYAGRPVMVQKNDYVLRLFNGDIGIALPDESGTLMVYFPSDQGGFRAISPLRLPEHETAFAMTVHKSQGSEFESLLILMPPRINPVITRELLYTGVTRARKKVALVCSETVLEEGIHASVKKDSGLMARLRELAD